MSLKRVFYVMLIILLPGLLAAQVTTSSITGTVKSTDGKALDGATVIATHVPTGTIYKAITGSNGKVNIANVQAGGPYKIEVTYVGLNPSIQEDVYLDLGQPFVLDATLTNQESKLMDSVVVVSRSGSIMKSNRSGASTVITRGQIQNLPSITRSVNDITRLTPQANGTSIGGGNYRSNNFTVDGANFNNQFGIGQNIPAGGSPISLDAIDQISINISPYDVRQSGFTGAAINAVTRSGKNNFFGTAFYTTRSDKQQGYRIGDVFAPISSLSVKQYAISFGGPIIKNKLFFFANIERSNTTQPGPSKVASTPGAPFGSASYIARPRATFLDSVSTYLKDKYGYETGPYQGYSNESNNNKLFARIDWNISTNHKINFRYSQVKSKTPNSISSSTTGSGVSFSTANNRTSSNALSFENSNYFQEDNQYSGTLEYTGRIGNYNHSFRATYVNQNSPRSSSSSLFPLVDIKDGASVLTTFGYEPFTYGNLRDVKTFTANYDGNYVVGHHNLTAGAQFETSKIKNGFQRFGTGYYVFDSWSDFVNGAKASNYALTYPLTADGSQAYPGFKFNQISIYAQDEISVTDKLKVTAGLRVELPSYPNVSEIKTQPLVAELTFANGEKVNTGVLPKTRAMLSPRVGFNYDIKGDRSIVLRGGSGIFTGRIPFVWIVAQSGDAGMLQFLQTYSGKANTPAFSPDPKANYPATIPQAGTSIPSSVSVMDRNLKFPSNWKSNLAVDIKLPYGLIGTLEGIYTKDINAVVARNINLNDPQALNVSGYADNRAIYASGVNRYINKLTTAGQVSPTGTANFDAIQMSNAKGGHYWSATAQLTKQFEKGLSGMVAYTLSGAKNYGDGSGDQILNLWSIPYNYSGNSNNPSLSYTDNVSPARIVATVSYAHEWIPNLKTTMTVVYTGSSQGRFSYYYTTDFNRDNQTNDLIYVPKDPSEIKFVDIAANTSGYSRAYTAQEQSDIFFNMVNSDSYLKTRKGNYAERNGAKFPWRHQFDFRFAQELFSGIAGGKNSLEFTWDVFNIGNLINSKWGIYKIANSGILTPMNVSSLTSGGTTVPTFRLGTANGDIIKNPYRNNETTASTYYMQFGLRLNFN